MNIAIYAGALNQWNLEGPECFWKDVPSPAGTELGVYGTAVAMARLGAHVDVFMAGPEGRIQGVQFYRPQLFPTLSRLHPYDVVVAIHDSRIFNLSFEAGLKVTLAPSQHLLLNPLNAQRIDKYFTYSRWSVENILKNEPEADRSKFWITRNGEWLYRYGWVERTAGKWMWDVALETKHDKNILVWASSPDRGLWHMVEILGRVRKYRPDVQLVVAYNFDEFLKNCTHEPSLEIVRKALPLKEMDGVTFTGHLSQPKLADLMMHAGILVYPGDVPENYCGILNNACAAGLPAICSDLGGVKELYGHAIHTEPHPVDAQKWAEDILSLLERPGAYADLQRTGLELASVTDFSEIGQEWLDFFSNREISADKGLAARLGR